MSLTAYHARYFAHELTKRSSSATIDSLTSALADAQVDLNPHQVEAALFAFRSPLSHGAILADEVGLGKLDLFVEGLGFQNGCGQEELVRKLLHPLLSEIRRTDDCWTIAVTGIHQAGEQCSFCEVSTCGEARA